MTLDRGTCCPAASVCLGEELALTEEGQPPPVCKSPASEESEELQFSEQLLRQKSHRKTLFKAIEIKERSQNSF